MFRAEKWISAARQLLSLIQRIYCWCWPSSRCCFTDMLWSVVECAASIQDKPVVVDRQLRFIEEKPRCCYRVHYVLPANKFSIPYNLHSYTTASGGLMGLPVSVESRVVVSEHTSGRYRTIVGRNGRLMKQTEQPISLSRIGS